MTSDHRFRSQGSEGPIEHAGRDMQLVSRTLHVASAFCSMSSNIEGGLKMKMHHKDCEKNVKRDATLRKLTVT